MEHSVSSNGRCLRKATRTKDRPCFAARIYMESAACSRLPLAVAICDLISNNSLPQPPTEVYPLHALSRLKDAFCAASVTAWSGQSISSLISFLLLSSVSFLFTGPTIWRLL